MRSTSCRRWKKAERAYGSEPLLFWHGRLGQHEVGAGALLVDAGAAALFAGTWRTAMLSEPDGQAVTGHAPLYEEGPVVKWPDWAQAERLIRERYYYPWLDTQGFDRPTGPGLEPEWSKSGARPAV